MMTLENNCHSGLQYVQAEIGLRTYLFHPAMIKFISARRLASEDTRLPDIRKSDKAAIYARARPYHCIAGHLGAKQGSGRNFLNFVRPGRSLDLPKRYLPVLNCVSVASRNHENDAFPRAHAIKKHQKHFQQKGAALNNPYTAPGANMPDADDYQRREDTYQPRIFAINGRIGRLRYLGYSFLLGLIAMVAAMFIGGILAAVLFRSDNGAPNPAFIGLMLLVYLPLIIVQFMMMRRRLNDLNLTGWMGLIYFVPIVGFFFVLYIMFAPGTDGVNDYGPKPVENPPGMILIVVLPFVMIAGIGILAAIAIPAYQDYTKRAHQMQHQQSQDQGSQLGGQNNQ